MLSFAGAIVSLPKNAPIGLPRLSVKSVRRHNLVQSNMFGVLKTFSRAVGLRSSSYHLQGCTPGQREKVSECSTTHSALRRVKMTHQINLEVTGYGPEPSINSTRATSRSVYHAYFLRSQDTTFAHIAFRYTLPAVCVTPLFVAISYRTLRY